MQTRNSLIAGRIAATLLSILTFAAGAAADGRPFTVHDLVAMDRVSDPQVSPDGRRVAYVLRSTDLEANGAQRDLWLADTLGQEEPRRLTTHAAADMEPRWAPDGDSLYFLSSRSGSLQVWQLPIAGGEARPVTDLPLDVANLLIAPDGGKIAFTLDVFVDCQDLACTKTRLDERAEAKATGVVYDRIFVRHWDTWKDGRRSHLFVMPLAGEEGGEPVDVTAGLDADVPSKPFGDSSEITFTPDGQGLVFAARQAGAEEPWSTDFNLWYAPADGSAAPRVLTDNPAWDTQPTFSPDGRTLAYLAMERAGYEADRFRIVLRDWQSGGTLGPPRVVAEAWDRSAGALVFSADGGTLWTTAQDTGNVPLFAIDVASGRVAKRVEEGHVRSPALAGERLVFGLDHLRSPVELFSIARDGGDRRQLTRHNRDRLEGVAMGAYEQFSFEGAGGDTVYGYLVEPADRAAATAGGLSKVPVAFIIHGGPQGSSGNDFHYRWNPQTYAGAGYAVVMIDFHGSTGYGQAFTDAIRDDWGGKPLEDLQKGLAAALSRYPWLDGERVCALGASYGGYMINWIAGNWPDRFRCLVNHDGLFDVRGMYYATEELWFPEWEFRGTPFSNPQGYARNNPALHVDKWRTPMLVVHGERDFRVPLTQGLATFTALQRRGIPSRLLYYPDENHWVLQPRNSIQWHDTVLAWLDRWLRPGSEASPTD